MRQTPDIAVTYQKVCAICCVCDERRVFTRLIEAELWRFTHEVEHSRHLVSVFAVGLGEMPILLDEDISDDQELDEDEFRLHNVEDEQTGSPRVPPKQTFVFGQIQKPGEVALIFIPEADAVRLAAIHHAIASAETWGDFFDAIPAGELAAVVERLNDGDKEDRTPSLSAKFDSDLLGCGDGDYPDFVEQKMLDWLPAQVCRQFGRMESSVLNGPLLSLDVRRTPEIIAALENAGFKCRIDDELVRRACGN